MKASKIAFERKYDYMSGVQYGVYYDENARTDWNVSIVGPGGDTVSIPHTEIRWYVNALEDVLHETEKDA